MIRVRSWKVWLSVLGIIFVLFLSVGCADASDGCWSKEFTREFRSGGVPRGFLENLAVDGSGCIYLPADGQFGNGLSIESYTRNGTRISTPSRKVSFRVVPANSKKLVSISLRVLQRGDPNTWSFRLEKDLEGYPSGELAWPGSKGFAFVDGSGKVTADLNSPGRVYEGG